MCKTKIGLQRRSVFHRKNENWSKARWRVAARVDFPYTNPDKQSSSLTAISDVQSVRLNELITVKGFITFGENIPQSAGSTGLIKLEGYLIDHSGSIRVTIWNDQIKEVKQGNSYLVENIRLHQYLGAKFLSSTPSTKFTELTTDKKKRIKPSNELVNESCDEIETKRSAM